MIIDCVNQKIAIIERNFNAKESFDWENVNIHSANDSKKLDYWSGKSHNQSAYITVI